MDSKDLDEKSSIKDTSVSITSSLSEEFENIDLNNVPESRYLSAPSINDTPQELSSISRYDSDGEKIDDRYYDDDDEDREFRRIQDLKDAEERERRRKYDEERLTIERQHAEFKRLKAMRRRKEDLRRREEEDTRRREEDARRRAEDERRHAEDVKFKQEREQKLREKALASALPSHVPPLPERNAASHATSFSDPNLLTSLEKNANITTAQPITVPVHSTFQEPLSPSLPTSNNFSERSLPPIPNTEKSLNGKIPPRSILKNSEHNHSSPGNYSHSSTLTKENTAINSGKHAAHPPKLAQSRQHPAHSEKSQQHHSHSIYNSVYASPPRYCKHHHCYHTYGSDDDSDLGLEYNDIERESDYPPPGIHNYRSHNDYITNPTTVPANYSPVRQKVRFQNVNVNNNQPLYLKPGDVRLGGPLCTECGGSGRQQFFLDDNICPRCGGFGRIVPRGSNVQLDPHTYYGY
ncbi:hypothetical protein TBLA_0C06840 [Henningerozyma blattae CBS 6284]|uniref:Uncharacterized protein n=1 Tax=Henningerozyma blattae (strain ATCC 34711 / CBS 6284 / DSM 70876 / NBRC 10599 / NRRL Y-10934 / UCD 77-7) TaxID=1071380 RepID=I2H274_HENB6|nr:hypothetical protein TBLA_0C06840 [Tetrapisispora blattae CBS 6284]CCH60476.1 hypothetical protein TBLA_0C06840 [Tetrapisispora blattae CBS 6284]